MGDLGVWDPLNPSNGMELLSELTVPWWVAGGWAIDLFYGAQTRPHGDFDIEVLRRDHQTVRRFMVEWDIHTAKDGQLEPWPLETPLLDDVNSVWCRPEADAPWQLQIMFALTDDELWLYRRDPRVTRSIKEIGYRTIDGIPVLCPEIQLLYKSTRPQRAQNEHDFRLIRPTLEPEQRAWLADALELSSPGHPWVPSLRD